jgi:penicillin-binding protein 1A
LLVRGWGCDDRYIRFHSMENGQGASTALPIWAKFFQKVYTDSLNFKNEINAEHKFPQPTERINIEMDCGKFKGKQQWRERKRVRVNYDLRRI